MSSLIYHPYARFEVLEALDWYAARSLPAAAGFGEELAEAERQILLSPNRWSAYLHGTHRFSLKRYSYAVVYLPRNEDVFGVAVAHLHRKPGYWKDRLDQDR